MKLIERMKSLFKSKQPVKSEMAVEAVAQPQPEIKKHQPKSKDLSAFI